MRVVLASTSRYRAALLQRLGIEFTVMAPAVDETPIPGEPALALCRRLAAAKAAAVAARAADALVIGSDQVLAFGTAVLGKPGDHATAVAQLQRMSGSTARFLTALHVRCPDGRGYDLAVPHAVHFRVLDDALIEAYLRYDTPYDCAGSFKSESAAPVLFAGQAGDDPTALVGLPLQRLSAILRAEGVSLFALPPGPAAAQGQPPAP